MDATAVPGAVCPAHPDQPVSFTCARCGAFACQVCRQQSGDDRCGACLARDQAQPLTVDAVVREGMALPFRLWERLLVIMAIQGVPLLAVSLYNTLVMAPHSTAVALKAMSHPDLGRILHLYGQMAGPIALVSMVTALSSNFGIACYVQVFGDAVGGRERQTPEVLRAGLRYFPATLLANLLRGLVVGVGALLCCLPGIWAMVIFSLVPAAVGLSGKGLGGSLSEGWALLKGRFWLCLGVQAVGWAVIFGGSMVSGVVAGVLKFMGPPGAVASALLAGVVGVVMALPLYGMNVVFYQRARAQGVRVG